MRGREDFISTSATEKSNYSANTRTTLIRAAGCWLVISYEHMAPRPVRL